MYLKYRIVECITSRLSQYELYRGQVYRYTPNRDQVYRYTPINDPLWGDPPMTVGSLHKW